MRKYTKRPNYTGQLMVIEGLGGSGKNTQRDLLANRLRKHGFSVKTLDFPRYRIKPWGSKIRDYLDGKLGHVDPAAVSHWYTLDRRGAKHQLINWLTNGQIVLLTRYYISNLAYQAVRLPQKNRARFIQTQRQLELVEYGLPDADLVIVLDLPPTVAHKLITNRLQKRSAEGSDIHEQSIHQIETTRQMYLELAKKYHWLVINGSISPAELLPPSTIAEQIWQVVEPTIQQIICQKARTILQQTWTAWEKAGLIHVFLVAGGLKPASTIGVDRHNKRRFWAIIDQFGLFRYTECPNKQGYQSVTFSFDKQRHDWYKKYAHTTRATNQKLGWFYGYTQSAVEEFSQAQPQKPMKFWQQVWSGQKVPDELALAYHTTDMTPASSQDRQASDWGRQIAKFLRQINPSLVYELVKQAMWEFKKETREYTHTNHEQSTTYGCRP